jgi:L-iditol 2-dehydrogenase
MKSLYFDVNLRKARVNEVFSKFLPFIRYSSIVDVRYGEIPDQPLPGPNWVRVKNILGGICGVDIVLFFGNADPTISMSALPGGQRFMGHEVIGRVEEVGDGVTDLSAGDRVTMQRYLPCCSIKEIDPPCGPCSEGNYTLCENFAVGRMPKNLGAGLSEKFIAHRSQLLKVPDEIPDEKAVLIEPSSVSLHAVLKRPPEDGENVLVIGAGTIGLNVIQFAKAVNPNCTVYVLEKIDFKKEFARKLGADYVIEGDPYDAVAKATGGKLYRRPGNTNILGGLDLIYDCVGYSQTIHDSLRWLKSRGDYVMVGNMLAPTSFDQTPIWHQEVRVTGINAHGMEYYDGKRISSFELAMEMIRDGKVNLDGFVTHRFPFAEYKRAFTLFKEKKERVIKVVLEIGS